LRGRALTFTLEPTQNRLSGPRKGGNLARRKRFQHGSLFKRGRRNKKWVRRWWEQVIDSEGKSRAVRRSEILGTVAELPTRRQAEQLLAQRMQKVNGEYQSARSTRKFVDFVRTDWEPVILPTMKYATQKSYAYFLRRHLIPAFGDLTLRELSRQRIQALLHAKLASGLAWESVHHVQCALSKILGAAVEWGYIEANPVRLTRLPRRSRAHAKAVLNPQQIRLLLAALLEPSRSVVFLLILTGLRVGELLALRWRNVDLQTALLRIEETVYDGHFDEPKSRRGIRLVPLGPLARAFLSSRQAHAVENREALVFSSRNGTPLDRHTLLSRQLKPVARALGLGKVTWHLLRHSNATLHDSLGTPLGTLQELLGHSSSEITRQLYVHSLSEDRRVAVEKLEALVFGPKWTQVSRLENLALPNFVEGTQDIGRGDRI
jgi:integrase